MMITIKYCIDCNNDIRGQKYKCSICKKYLCKKCKIGIAQIYCYTCYTDKVYKNE
jgi:hypothetical protein